MLNATSSFLFVKFTSAIIYLFISISCLFIVNTKSLKNLKKNQKKTTEKRKKKKKKKKKK